MSHPFPAGYLASLGQRPVDRHFRCSIRTALVQRRRKCQGHQGQPARGMSERVTGGPGEQVEIVQQQRNGRAVQEKAQTVQARRRGGAGCSQ